VSTTLRQGKAVMAVRGSTRRFDSVLYSVCPARRTNARGIVTAYYHVLISVRRRGWARGTRPSYRRGEDGTARESVWERRSSPK